MSRLRLAINHGIFHIANALTQPLYWLHDLRQRVSR